MKVNLKFESLKLDFWVNYITQILFLLQIENVKI